MIQATTESEPVAMRPSNGDDQTATLPSSGGSSMTSSLLAAPDEETKSNEEASAQRTVRNLKVKRKRLGRPIAQA